MALDIHRSDNNEYIFGINDELYNCLEPIFEQFKYATGFRIDPYSDTKLNVDNIKLLIKLIDKYIEKADLNKDKKKTMITLEFRGLLNLLIKHNLPISLYGD